MLFNRCVSRVDSVVRLIWARIVFFLLLRMSQRWWGLMQSATLLVNMAVMHPFRPLLFILTVYAPLSATFVYFDRLWLPPVGR
jgi:hypothetical protein